MSFHRLPFPCADAVISCGLRLLLRLLARDKKATDGAGDDPITVPWNAMDAVGLAVFQHYGTEKWIQDKPVWQQVQLAEAVKVGVGVKGPDEITLVGDGVEELADIEAHLRAV